MSELTFHYLADLSADVDIQIARWYQEEWDIPEETTRESLAGKRSRSIPLQIVGILDDRPIVTGGIYNIVGLLRTEERFQEYGPWLALVYTDPSERRKGFAAQLCRCLDDEVRSAGISRYYLFTFTAESLYRRLGWIEMERLEYRGHDTVVMYRDLP